MVSSHSSSQSSQALWVGVDEVGRGCLAGPVYAGAVSLVVDESPVPGESPLQSNGGGESKLSDFFSVVKNFNTSKTSKFRDSKQLTAAQRTVLSREILSSHLWGLGFATVEEIESINILQASLLAMRRAVENLSQKVGARSLHLLIDGIHRIPEGISSGKNSRGSGGGEGEWDLRSSISQQGLIGRCSQTTIVGGDAQVPAISAASIIAKVARDEYMMGMAKQWPGYGFDRHKGYGSVEHRRAIASLGPTEIHRKTFRGVREFLKESYPSPLKGVHYQKGIHSEELVVKHLEGEGFHLLKRRWKTPFAEVDLIFEKVDPEREKREIWVVEVKAIAHENFLPTALKTSQRQRLRRALGYLQNHQHQLLEGTSKGDGESRPLHFVLALVFPGERVEILPHFEL